MWELRNTNTSASILIVCHLKVFGNFCVGCSGKASNQSSVPESATTLETATNRSSLCWWKAIVRICHSYPATLSISLVSWLQTSQSQSSLGSGTVRQKKGQVGYHAQTNKATTNALVVALFAMSSWILVAVQWPKPTMIHPTGPLKFTSLIHSWSQMEILEGRKGFKIFTLSFAIHKTAGSIFGNQRSNFWDCRRTVTKECTHHARAEYDRYTCWLFT